MFNRILTEFLVFLLLCSCAIAAKSEKGWGQLSLEKTEITGATVYYEKIFEDKLGSFELLFKKTLAEIRANNTILAKKDAIIADINKILGEKKPNSQMQSDVFDKSMAAFSKINEFIFYLVLKKTTKDFLRSGGNLPGFKYDKTNDKVLYGFQFGSDPKGGRPEKIDLAIPISSHENFNKDTSVLTWLVRANSRLAIHETAELSLLFRLRTKAPYLRWFSDGTADVIAYELTKKHVSEDKAQEFLSEQDVARYKELEKEINLRYWMSMTYAIARSGDKGSVDKLELPRYRYAMFEVKRLVDEHGIDCIKKIMDAMTAKKPRTCKELFTVIKEVTGEDMEERLKRYQTFDTREEGMKKYASIAKKKAFDEKDPEAFVEYGLRMLEMYDSPFDIDSLMSRKMIAMALREMGHEQLADETMEKCVSFLKSIDNKDAAKMGLQMFISYAIQCGKANMAIGHAEEMFKLDPGNIHTLAVRMITMAEEGKMDEAKESAAKVVKLSQQGSELYQIAQKILAD
jgi:hypothetical protein